MKSVAVLAGTRPAVDMEIVTPCSASAPAILDGVEMPVTFPSVRVHQNVEVSIKMAKH